MIKKDDRTPEERKTLVWGIVGRDRFLSGWGGAAGGYSRAAWACRDYNHAVETLPRIKARGDMQYVSLVRLDTYRPPRGTAHYHIYVEKN